MEKKAESKASFLIFWIILILLYVIVFEFIFPSNKILPGLGLLIDSILPLEKEYHITFNFLYSFTGIYLTVIIGYFVFELLAVNIVGFLKNFFVIIKFISSLRFIPILGVITIFILWFPYSFISEYIFYFAFTFVFLVSSLKHEKRNIKSEYIDPVLTVTGSASKIINKVIFKQCQPEIFYSIRKLHIYMWTVMLVFEFVKAQSGLGSIFKTALLYNDLSVIFLTTVFLFIIICIGDYVIRLIFNKTYHWEK